MPQLPELIQALLDPRAYPDNPKEIGLMQTQMSLIFLAGDYVYKVKKPVNLGYLDYTTLDKRHVLCLQEVELNRRLCPETYLGVIPIMREGSVIHLGGKGEVIEYAVKMRYLPQEKMMNVLLLRDQVSTQMITALAKKLADFHERAETNSAISFFGSLEAITVNTSENFTQTKKYIGLALPLERFQHIQDYTNNFLKKNADLFLKRVAEGRIRDYHGDLHAAHICFTDDIVIYDCIEFNDRFRYGDVASEIAFLAMDLDHYGKYSLSRSFIDAYVAASEDKELLQLLNFYKCYRAYVRGKVACFQYDDTLIQDRESVLSTAQKYFELAESYI